MDGLAEALARCEWLRGMRAQNWPWHSHDYVTGEALTDRYGGRPCVGLVLSGRVEVSLTAPDGRDNLIRTMRAGDCFGVSNLFSDEALQTKLRCMEPTSVAYIKKEYYRNILSSDASLALGYAELCSTKLSFLLKRIGLLSAQSARSRLAAWLLAQRDELGVVRLDGSLEALAKRLNMSRAGFFREWSALQSSGAIRSGRKEIIILLPDVLAGFLDETGKERMEADPV